MKYKKSKKDRKLNLATLRRILKRIGNWKAPDHDEIYGFCLKRYTSIHNRLAQQRKCLQEVNIPEWITKGKFILIQKDPHQKRITTKNHRKKILSPYRFVSRA